MVRIETFKDIHSGTPAAVLGGGPSLPGHLDLIPDDCVLIAVNDHAGRYVDPHYCVFMDTLRRERHKRIRDYVESFDGFRLSNNEFSDIDLSGVNYWDGGFSPSLATWFAGYTGADTIILCGFDCYQGENFYCWFHVPDERDRFLMSLPLENHLRAWEPAIRRVPNAERIRVAGGPLEALFPKYEPKGESCTKTRRAKSN